MSRRTQYQMVGLARIARITDTDLYEPDPTGVWAFVTPVRVEHPATPESRLPEACARLGQLVDIVAWDPRYPHDWALRIGHAYWLGCVPAQCSIPILFGCGDRRWTGFAPTAMDSSCSPATRPSSTRS